MSKGLITISVLFLSLQVWGINYPFSDSLKTKPGDGKKDTAKAIVSYGRDFMFESAQSITESKLATMIDSLLSADTINQKLLREINVYKSVMNKPEKEVYHVIDSLFTLDDVPFALINELNFYVSHMPEPMEVAGFQVFDPNVTSAYPANAYYKSWNARYPFNYPASLSAQDSTVVLVLRDSLKGWDYKHPLGPKSLRRYFGIVTSGFGWRDGRSHNGVDLELHLWDTVYNCFPGVVRMARNYAGYGNMVVVRHYNGLETLYAHLSRIKVRSGDTIKAGQLVGLGGSTGSSTGTHLHLEMRFKGVPLNPSHLISFKNRDLYADTLVLKKTRHSYAAYPHGAKIHTVQRGDYLHKVAKRYAITTDKLCELNGFTRKTRLSVGQRIRISE